MTTTPALSRAIRIPFIPAGRSRGSAAYLTDLLQEQFSRLPNFLQPLNASGCISLSVPQNRTQKWYPLLLNAAEKHAVMSSYPAYATELGYPGQEPAIEIASGDGDGLDGL